MEEVDIKDIKNNPNARVGSGPRVVGHPTTRVEGEDRVNNAYIVPSSMACPMAKRILIKVEEVGYNNRYDVPIFKRTTECVG